MLNLGGAVGVAFFDQSRVEDFFDDAPPGDSRFFDDLIIIRGIIVVIVGRFILLNSRFGILFCGLFARVLGDHIGKPRAGRLSLFTLGLRRPGARGDDVAEAAFELFA